MHGKLTLTDGVVSATVAPGAHMDAAVVGEHGGIELAVKDATVFLGQAANEWRANPIISLALDPQTMQVLALELLHALGAPAFTDPEWLKIADACEQAGLGELAERINAGRANTTGGSDG
jgi:hypothetical protein